MSISLNDRWLIEVVAVTGRPLALPRARLSRAQAVVTWSTSRRAPVSSTRARSRSSMIFSAIGGTLGRPMRPANSPSVAPEPLASPGSGGRWATRAVELSGQRRGSGGGAVVVGDIAAAGLSQQPDLGHPLAAAALGGGAGGID